MPSTNIAQQGPFTKTNRSAFANFIRAKYEMYTGAVRVGSYPYHLLVESSDVCQLRCPTCVTGIENELRRQHAPDRPTFRSDRTKMTPERFQALLEEVGEYLFMVMFYNFGEPLLNKDLPALIRLAKSFDVETDINTNLSLPLSDRQIEEVLSSGLDYLYASIDGFSQESYEKHRVGGNLQLVIENLTRIAKTRDRLGVNTLITYNFLVFSHNEHEIPLAEMFCDDLGIHFNTRDAFVHDPEWLPSYRKGELPRRVAAAVTLPEGFQYYEGQESKAWSPLPELQGLATERCSWHYGYSVVSAGGNVAPCCGVPHAKHDFGRMGPGVGSFASVWNNDALQASRAAFSGKSDEAPAGVETVCTRCPLPPFMFQLYSLHDFKVVAQYARSIGASDPLLNEAFELFTRARYGVPVADLFPNGWGMPERVLEMNDPAGAAAFVEYFEHHLPHEGPFLPPEGRTREVFLKMA